MAGTDTNAMCDNSSSIGIAKPPYFEDEKKGVVAQCDRCHKFVKVHRDKHDAIVFAPHRWTGVTYEED